MKRILDKSSSIATSSRQSASPLRKKLSTIACKSKSTTLWKNSVTKGSSRFELSEFPNSFIIISLYEEKYKDDRVCFSQFTIEKSKNSKFFFVIEYNK